MGIIPHVGILTIGFSNSKRREFILLGATYGNEIRDSILAKAGLGSPR
jgi:hypothetical protein